MSIILSNSWQERNRALSLGNLPMRANLSTTGSVINLVSTHEGGRVEQKRTPYIQGGGGLTLRSAIRTQQSPFLHIFCNILIHKVFLPYFVVFGVDFHNSFIKICYDYFHVSQMFYNFFHYAIINCMFKNIPARNGRGVRWVRVWMQWEGVVACAYDGEGGSNFSHIGAYVLNEWRQLTISMQCNVIEFTVRIYIVQCESTKSKKLHQIKIT